MAEITTVVCDECGAQKKQVNHWYCAYKLLSSVTLVPMDSVESAEGRAVRHLCGQSCVGSMIDRWMTTGSLEK